MSLKCIAVQNFICEHALCKIRKTTQLERNDLIEKVTRFEMNEAGQTLQLHITIVYYYHLTHKYI